MKVVALRAGFIDNVLRTEGEEFIIDGNFEITDSCWFQATETAAEEVGLEPDSTTSRRSARRAARRG